MAKWLVELKQYSKQGDIFFNRLSLIVEGDTPEEVAATVNANLQQSLDASAAILQNKIQIDPPEHIHLFFQQGRRNIITKIKRVTHF